MPSPYAQPPLGPVAEDKKLKREIVTQVKEREAPREAPEAAPKDAKKKLKEPNDPKTSDEKEDAKDSGMHTAWGRKGKEPWQSVFRDPTMTALDGGKAAKLEARTLLDAPKIPDGKMEQKWAKKGPRWHMVSSEL